MYEKYGKRVLDILLSLAAVGLLWPLFPILTALGAVLLRGNPFFVQPRIGKNEKAFRLIKFRTMRNTVDENGDLLPDAQRLTKYGTFLRDTSLDELPELFHILRGDMSIVGPRPLLVKYLPLYNSRQKRRHAVRPGLTGLAQVNGRNAITWEERLRLDVQYVENISFAGDLRIMLQTLRTLLKRSGVRPAGTVTMEEFQGTK